MLIASSIAALALPANTASYVARPDLYKDTQQTIPFNEEEEREEELSAGLQ